MGVADLSQLLPLGGATVLLVYLIGVIIQERRQSTKDRNAERAQWQADRARLIAEHRAESVQRDEDKDRTIAYLRQRVLDLNLEHDAIHKRLIAVEHEHGECRAMILALEDQIRELRGRLP